MEHTDAYYRHLAHKWAEGTISPEEAKEYLDWYNADDEHALLIPPEFAINKCELKQRMLSSIQHEIAEEKPVIPIRRNLIRISAAAAVILVLTGSYFLFFNNNNKQDKIVKSNSPVKDVEAPQQVRAMITLSDGRTVALDSIGSGELASQGNVKVTKNEAGEIVYTGSNNEVQYNTLFNPRGSQAVNLTLVDGSRVWMNAESSLKYFTSLVSGERRVEISGECYFEAAHDPAKPFIVKDIKSGAEVEVIGTHFNVNTYGDDDKIKITLLEGSVKVKKGELSELIKPGQQAQVGAGINVMNGVDIEQVMAWKNGLFKFNGQDLQVIMKQIERWYNVDIAYEGKLRPLTFGGVISRKKNASDVLELLSLTGLVNFKFENAGGGSSARIKVEVK